MPRITEDPTQATCPSFEDPEWEFLWQSMVDAYQGDQPFTLEDAAQHLKDTWARENECKIGAWNAQLEDDRILQEELDRLAQEEEDARRIQREKEAEEQRKEAEKKRPKLGDFDSNLPVERWIEPRPSSYAIQKLDSLEYLELDYFTLRACKEAGVKAHKSVNQDTMAITQLGDSFAFRPLSALKPSKNIRNDEDLCWEEMLDAKNLMLHFMAKSGLWPTKHAEALATFFLNLELHPRKSQVNGKKALMLYQSRVRREWFDALKNGAGFNIALIQDDLLRSYAEELNDAIQDRDNASRDREIDQVCVSTHLDQGSVLTVLPFSHPPPPPPYHLRCCPSSDLRSSLLFAPWPFVPLPFAPHFRWHLLPRVPCHLHPIAACISCRVHPAICTPLPLASPAAHTLPFAPHRCLHILLCAPCHLHHHRHSPPGHVQPLPFAPPPHPRLHTHAITPPLSAPYPACPQLRRANASLEARSSSRRHQARSPSPSRVKPTRRRCRSRSPYQDREPQPDCPDRLSRDSARRPRRVKSEFFQPGAGPRGGVCAVCLGRHEHNFGKCEEPRLWDNSASASRKNEQGRLVAASGLPLCFDWQVSRGCASSSHPDRHRCSGCGKADHGAQGCP